MRVPSRRMPPAEGAGRPWLFLVGATFVGLLALVVSTVWGTLLTTVTLATTLFVMGIILADGLVQSRRTAKERAAESICTFARSFDCRSVDTWAIRAVYEMYSTSYPVRSADDVDSEELAYDAELLAERAGRSLDGCEANPFYGRVSTAGDLVQFLSHQPRLEGHPSRGE
ncbi:hypothetical protein [Engelhardtia mirabilis]|uniref:Uncharacterized protein n=1 Tax=Engelhardtia mirabilis TaxID=2528011 RepID=A0A518BQW0_9BACT|nr:hypothetical protein Pla133_44860 [Planctomycetes bacterium Pla133]QDV03693.1 hypothetical protein Pla86_44840 [Planctomycetes bacterium Pla86]